MRRTHSPHLSLNRTHPARCDDSWLPASLMRGPRGAFAGVVWTSFAGSSVLAGLAGGLPLLLPGALLLGWLAASTYTIGDGAIQRALRTHLYRRLRQGPHTLSTLAQRTEGELLCVRGVIHAERFLHGVIDPREAVYRRLFFRAGNGELTLHEAAVDFWLIQADQTRLAVQTKESQLVTAHPALHEQAPELLRELLALPLYPEIEDELRWRYACVRENVSVPPLRAGEFLLRPGDEVLIVGRREVRANRALGGRLAREEFMTPTMTAGKILPLVIVPLAARSFSAAREESTVPRLSSRENHLPRW